MFARFDENPAMTLQVIKETKRYERTHGRTDNMKQYTHHKQSLRGYNKNEVLSGLEYLKQVISSSKVLHDKVPT